MGALIRSRFPRTQYSSVAAVALYNSTWCYRWCYHLPMATVEKLSVSLGAEEISWVRKKAEESASSVSAVLNEAVRQQQRLEAMDRLLEELGTDDITPEDIAAMLADSPP